MRMKKFLIIAAAALLAAACAKTYEVKQTTPPAIGFGTWSDVMTKAPKTDFVANDEFDVFGFKWKTGPTDQTTVFDGVDVRQQARLGKAEAQKARQEAAKKSNKTNKSNKAASMSSKMTQSQRNDSIRAAQQRGRKINKSSADND